MYTCVCACMRARVCVHCMSVCAVVILYMCVLCAFNVCVCVLSCLLTSCAYYDGVLRFPSRRDTRRAHEQPRTVVPWLYPTYGDGAADTLWVRQNPFLEKSRTTFLACLAVSFLKKSHSATFLLEIRKVIIECNVRNIYLVVAFICYLSNVC